jgi:hypothetical protein
LVAFDLVSKGFGGGAVYYPTDRDSAYIDAEILDAWRFDEVELSVSIDRSGGNDPDRRLTGDCCDVFEVAVVVAAR